MVVINEETLADPYGEKYIKMMEDRVRRAPDPDIPKPHIVLRDEWGALPPKETTPLVQPAQVALFTQTETDECYTREECIKFLQTKQIEDMNEKELPDIQYNFYIGSDKTIYEGRGWNVDADKDDVYSNLEGKSLDIAYIGNFEDKELSYELVEVGCNLTKYGVGIKLIHEHFTLSTLWEDHVEILRMRLKRNALDDEGPKLTDSPLKGDSMADNDNEPTSTISDISGADKSTKPEAPKDGPLPYPFKFVSRSEWGALPATNKVLLNHPVEHFTYRFSSTDPCNNREDCIKRMQELQKYHMFAKGMPDIAFNFVIGGDLTVYEGRGWLNKPQKLDEKLSEYANKTIDIGYMGYPNGGIKKNYYCVEILELRDALVEYGIEGEYLDEFALVDRIDVMEFD